MKNLILLVPVVLLACEKSASKSTSTPAPATTTKTTTPTTQTTPPPARVSLGWPPYTCPTYSAADATTEQEIDLKLLKSIEAGDTLETMSAEAKNLLRDTEKVTTRTDVLVDGCTSTLVYTYEAEQFEDSGTATAYSFKFWVCDGVVDKITFCHGIDGK